MLTVAAVLLEWRCWIAHSHAVLLGRSRGHEHGRAVLERTGHAGVVGKACVAVSRGQGWV